MFASISYGQTPPPLVSACDLWIGNPVSTPVPGLAYSAGRAPLAPCGELLPARRWGGGLLGKAWTFMIGLMDITF